MDGRWELRRLEPLRSSEALLRLSFIPAPLGDHPQVVMGPGVLGREPAQLLKVPCRRVDLSQLELRDASFAQRLPRIRLEAQSRRGGARCASTIAQLIEAYCLQEDQLVSLCRIGARVGERLALPAQLKTLLQRAPLLAVA